MSEVVDKFCMPHQSLKLAEHPMRILLIQHSPPKSGIGMYTLNLYKNLKAQNVVMVDISDPKELGVYSSQLHKFKRSLELGKDILKLPKQYDVFHVSSQMLSVCCSWAKPAVLTIHDFASFLGSGDKFMNFVFKFNFSFALQAAAVICPSQFTSKQVTSRLKLDSRKIHVIPHGVDHTLFHKRDQMYCRKALNLPQDAKIIVSNSNTFKHKNLSTLLRAFKIVLAKEPRARLIRVGAPNPNSPELAGLAKTLGIADSVVYMKPSDEELAYVYSSSDVLVHTSTYEGFGAPIAEAMASGIPVVTSNAASVPEVVGDAGIMLDPFDIEGFASETLNILSNKENSMDLSEKGIARSRLFTWDRCAQQTYKVYEEAAKRG